MDNYLHYLSLTEIAARLRRRELTSLEVTTAILDRIAAHDGVLGSYLTVLAERSLDQAEKADAEMRRGLYRSPLHGIPVAVKDVIDTQFAPSTAGMAIYTSHFPAHNATVINRLESAGAILVGKLTTTEGVYIAHHEKLRTPANPRNKGYWTGVSSSGSGVATAAGLCFGSLGTDTGGSIRVPSTINGLTGLKPTWGRVSRKGLFPFSPTMDHIGPMARNAMDAAAILHVIAGHDRDDPTSLHAPVPEYLGSINQSIRGLRIGLDWRYATETVDTAVVEAFTNAIAVLKELCATIVPVDVPFANSILEVGAVISAVESATSHRDTYPARAAEYGAALKAKIEEGLATSVVQFATALQERQNYIGRFSLLFRDIDLLAMPTIPVKVPTLEQLKDFMAAPHHMGRFTFPSDITGNPALTLPCGEDNNGHPIGLQLVGNHLGEEVLLRAGHAFQSITDWHTRHPAL